MHSNNLFLSNQIKSLLSEIFIYELIVLFNVHDLSTSTYTLKAPLTSVWNIF